MIPDQIDWSHVAPEWKWMARDANGETWLYNNTPEPKVTCWRAGGDCIECIPFASYRRGTVAWQDSLVQRPEGV